MSTRRDPNDSDDDVFSDDGKPGRSGMATGSVTVVGTVELVYEET